MAEIMNRKIRLWRALNERRRSVTVYYQALREGGPLDDLAACCRKTDDELTRAMEPFTAEIVRGRRTVDAEKD
jgi:hypothetical protein